MRRSPRVWIARIVAVVVAIVTVRVVAHDLSALHRRARSLGRDVSIVVASRNLALGATITAADLHTLTRPARTVLPDTLRDARNAIGRIVAVPLVRDDPVRDAHLARADRTGIDAIVPFGRRAMHVVVPDGFRPPAGAVVDIVAAFDASSVGESRSSAVVVARGARVLAVDPGGPVDAADSTAAGASAVTVLVGEGEAPGVAAASASGRISLAVAPPESASR